jgi:hypothetical protein
MICNYCMIEKNESDFYNRYKTCKECVCKKQRERNKITKKISGYKICNKCNVNKIVNDFRKNRGECKDCERKYGRNYYKNNKEIREKWVNSNKNRMKYLQANWYQNNKEKRNAEYKLKYENIPEFKLWADQKSILYRHINKIKRTEEYLGINTYIIKKWFEFCFDENMNWNNHGDYWHIDHVLPIANFNLQNQNDIDICFNWKNLMPIQKEINLIKGNKLYENQYNKHIKNLITFFKINKMNENLDNFLIHYQDYYATHLDAGNSLEL